MIGLSMYDQQILRNALARLVLVSAFCTNARAEIVSKVPGDFGWRKSIPLHLLLSTAEVDDLGLSEEIVHKLRSLHQQIQHEVEIERSKLDNESSKDRQSKPFVRRYDWNEPVLHAVRNRHNDELNRLLTLQQQERLYQIHLQRRRKQTDVLCDSGVAKEIGLNSAQRSAIYERHRQVVRAEMDEVKMCRRYTGPRSCDLEETCPEAIMKILTEEQRQSFQILLGRPLK